MGQHSTKIDMSGDTPPPLYMYDAIKGVVPLGPFPEDSVVPTDKIVPASEYRPFFAEDEEFLPTSQKESPKLEISPPLPTVSNPPIIVIEDDEDDQISQVLAPPKESPSQKSPGPEEFLLLPPTPMFTKPTQNKENHSVTPVTSRVEPVVVSNSPPPVTVATPATSMLPYIAEEENRDSSDIQPSQWVSTTRSPTATPSPGTTNGSNQFAPIQSSIFESVIRPPVVPRRSTSLSAKSTPIRTSVSMKNLAMVSNARRRSSEQMSPVVVNEEPPKKRFTTTPPVPLRTTSFRC